jgi:hypothetical protein
MLASGEFATICEIAVAAKINKTYIGPALRLTLLAPDIVEGELGGSQQPELTKAALMRLMWSGVGQPAEHRCRKDAELLGPVPSKRSTAKRQGGQY